MSSDSPKDSERREIAAGLVATGRGRMMVTTAMKTAGYSTPEIKMNTKQKRVSRRAKGIAKTLEAVKAGTVVPGSITVEPEQSSGGTGRSSLTSTSTTSAAAAAAATRTTRSTRTMMPTMMPTLPGAYWTTASHPRSKRKEEEAQNKSKKMMQQK